MAEEQKGPAHDPWNAAAYMLKALAPDYLTHQYEPPQIGPETPPGKVGPGEMSPYPWAAVDAASFLPGMGAKAAGAALAAGGGTSLGVGISKLASALRRGGEYSGDIAQQLEGAAARAGNPTVSQGSSKLHFSDPIGQLDKGGFIDVYSTNNPSFGIIKKWGNNYVFHDDSGKMTFPDLQSAKTYAGDLHSAKLKGNYPPGYSSFEDYRSDIAQSYGHSYSSYEPTDTAYLPTGTAPVYARDIPREVPWQPNERAKQLGFNVPAAHGTKTPDTFDEFRLPTDELGIHFGSPRAAQERIGDWVTPNHAHRVYPTVLRANHPLELPDLGTWDPKRVADALVNYAGFPHHEVQEVVGRSSVPSRQTEALRELIHSKGFDSVKYENKVEDAGHTSHMVMHPSRVRSPWAAFDPSKIDSSNLLATLAGGGVMTPAVKDYVDALKKKR